MEGGWERKRETHTDTVLSVRLSQQECLSFQAELETIKSGRNLQLCLSSFLHSLSDSSGLTRNRFSGQNKADSQV